MASGVAVHESCVKAFEEIKTGKKHRYVIFALNNELKEISPIKCGDRATGYDEFLKELTDSEKAGQSRYAIFDCHYTLPSGQEREKLCMVFWNPDTAPVKQKMVYSSSKEAFKKKLNISLKDLQANDTDDLKYESILEHLQKFDVN